MYALAFAGSVVLLAGAFPRYTSRPDLLRGIDTPFSLGALASMAAGVAAIVISWRAMTHDRPHDLQWLLVPAGFTVLQLLKSLQFMSAVAFTERERIGPGPGLVLSVLGAMLVGYAGYSGMHS
jgi:hypothetical protein